MRIAVVLVALSATSAAADPLKVAIQDDEGKVTVVPLLEDREITIGRVEGNTIRLTQRNVSPRHAKLTCRAGSCTLDDVGSEYGIRVNRKRIVKRATVRDKDMIQIGGYKLFLSKDGSVPPVPPAVLTMGARKFVLDRDTITIGSAADNQVVLADRSVSQYHARIERERDHYRLVDLGSDRGVRINGEDYYRVELIDGDEIQLGAIKIRFTAK